MKKLCVVYNFAQHYREPIFRLIDREWDCEWWFGRNTTDIKGMPREALRHVTYVDNRRLFGPATWQQGVGRLIRRCDLDAFLMLGEPMCLSSWWILLQRRLFYRRKRVYLWTHGWYGREGFAKKWIKRAYFGMADHVFTYGEYARGRAIAQGFDGGKITPIHNSLDHERQTRLRATLKPSDTYRARFGNDYPVIIFIGRLTRSKRLDMAVDALKRLDERGRRFNLTLIGDGEARRELQARVEESRLADRVWFYGACYDDTLNARLIFDADLCLSPGNVGLTAMHAMVFGTPVITHNDFRYQNPEFEAIRPGQTGDFFTRGSIDSMVDTIDRWFSGDGYDRETVREACYNEIDTQWTPEYQINVLREHME